MKMAPSVPAVTMNYWLGAIAICNKRYTASLSSSRYIIMLDSLTYLCDLTGVADTLVVADTLIVVPKLDDLVVS